MGLFDGGGLFKDVSWEHPFGGDNSIFNRPFGSKPQGPAAPGDPPDPSLARQDALNAQIDQELQIRRSNTTSMTGGMGVMGQPQVQSAGQLLFGV